MMFKNNNILNTKGILTSLLLLATVVILSCKKDKVDVNLNALNFARTDYSIPQSGEVTIQVFTSKPVSASTTIPITITGTAVRGVDYELSADNFIIPAGETTGEIKVKSKESFDFNKSFKVEFGTLPADLSMGTLLFTEIAIQPRDILLYSFDASKSTLAETAEIRLDLTAAEGTFIAQQEIRIPVTLATGTTAVEGVNFSFDGPKEFVIPAGKSRGTLKLKSIKQQVGKDLIVLKVVPPNKHYAAGNYNTSKITIFGSSFTKLKGTWKYKAFSNRDWLIENTSYMGDDPAALPKSSDADKIIIDEVDGAISLSTEMTGDLKNYFRPAKITNLGEITEYLQEAGGIRPPMVKIQLLNLSAMNVFFSAKKEKIRSGELGLRVFVDGGKEILEVTIRDYEPTDFLAETYEMYKSFGDVPAMKSLPMRYHFERVN
jgi:hypothetical protein